MPAIVVIASLFYLFVRIFRREESRRILYYLEGPGSRKHRHHHKRQRRAHRGDYLDSDGLIQYTGKRRRSFDVDMYNAIWEDGE